MRVLLTGAQGFVAKNLALRLSELPGYEVLPFSRQDPPGALAQLAARADLVVHLAGTNRPPDEAEFQTGNVGLTHQVCEAVAASGRPTPIVFSSSTQAALDNAYGRSKAGGERVLEEFARRHGSPVRVLRLPNVFGKWCRPNYNSAVATFCHNIARGLPINIRDPSAPLSLVYVDDVVARLVELTRETLEGFAHDEVRPVYQTTVGQLAEEIRGFGRMRSDLVAGKVGVGFLRALYATYVSYLPPEQFAYPVPAHGDPRGVFVEMLKTEESGQFSFFTAHPGVTRGGHYHHTKTEKFLVISGKAKFRFRHLLTGEYHELETSGEAPRIVETIPGWTHDITNVGEGLMVVMLWANEIFDRARPDTIAKPL